MNHFTQRTDNPQPITRLFHPKTILKLFPLKPGQPITDKNIRHLNTHGHINHSGRFGVWLDTWTKKKLDEHISWQETYFYTSRPEWGLLAGDIDCHNIGSIQEAIALAKELKEKFFADLHFEPSTNGNGVHFYLIVDWHWQGTAEKTAVYVRKQCNRLADWLTAYAKNRGFEIDQVEIKGTPSFDTWNEKGLPDVDFGQACKLPRNIDAAESTTRIHLDDLMKIVANNKRELRDHLADKRKQVQSNPDAKVSLNKSVGDESLLLTRQDVIDQFPAADALLASVDFKTNCKQRLNVLREDLAAFLAMTAKFAETPNRDGSMPTARYAKVWRMCFEEGVTDRAFNPSRFAAIRNALVDYGVVDMTDNRYSFHPKASASSTKVDGFAMQWSLNANQVHWLVSVSASLDSSCSEETVESQAVGNIERDLYPTQLGSDPLPNQKDNFLTLRTDRIRPQLCSIVSLSRERLPDLATAA